MLCDEIIERFKSEIPKLKNVCDHTIYGITHLDIKCDDGSVKQIVLVFERLRVDEPKTFLYHRQIYADVYIKIRDDVLTDIAAKQISLEDAITAKLFKVYGDAEIWKLQLNALKEILPNECFAPRRRRFSIEDYKNDAATSEEVSAEGVTDYSNLPRMDLSSVPKEFTYLTEHFAALSHKYPSKTVTFHGETKKE